MTQPISIDGVEFIEVDGLKIRFQRDRAGGGMPVVLTSPWPESLYAYQRIWPILGAEASLIAFDIPGFGQSEGRPELMSPRAMGDFIPKILAALGLDRVHAIGPTSAPPRFSLRPTPTRTCSKAWWLVAAPLMPR
jgi:pimeloyl-ACP methyl ester carboxylesterase